MLMLRQDDDIDLPEVPVHDIREAREQHIGLLSQQAILPFLQVDGKPCSPGRDTATIKHHGTQSFAGKSITLSVAWVERS